MRFAILGHEKWPYYRGDHVIEVTTQAGSTDACLQCTCTCMHV